MRYRDAKKLHNGDEVIRKSDKVSMIVNSVECYGQYKKVKINCIINGSLTSIYNDEVE
jgi:hypothetical protein